MASSSIDKWINSLYLQISEILDKEYSNKRKKTEYTLSMVHYTSFNKKERIRKVKMSISLWEKTEDVNKKIWTKFFPTRTEALEFLDKYLKQISKSKKEDKKKRTQLLLL